MVVSVVAIAVLAMDEAGGGSGGSSEGSGSGSGSTHRCLLTSISRSIYE